MVTDSILNDNSVQIKVDLNVVNDEQVKRHTQLIEDSTRSLETRARTFMDTISRGEANLYVPGTYDRMVESMREVEQFHKRLGIESENVVQRIDYQTGQVTSSQKANNRAIQRAAQEELEAQRKLMEEEQNRLQIHAQIRRHVEATMGQYLTAPGANVAPQERTQFEEFTEARGGVRSEFQRGQNIQRRQDEIQQRLEGLRESEPEVQANAEAYATSDRTRVAAQARRAYRELGLEIRALEREAKRLDRELKQHNRAYKQVFDGFKEGFETFDASIRGISADDVTKRFRESEITDQYLAGDLPIEELFEQIATQMGREYIGLPSDTMMEERAEQERIRMERENAQKQVIGEQTGRLQDLPNIIREVIQSSQWRMSGAEAGSYGAYQADKERLSGLEDQRSILDAYNAQLDHRFAIISDEAASIREQLFSSDSNLSQSDRSSMHRRLYGLDQSLSPIAQERGDLDRQSRQLEDKIGSAQDIFNHTWGRFQMKVGGDTEDSLSGRVREVEGFVDYIKGDLSREDFIDAFKNELNPIEEFTKQMAAKDDEPEPEKNFFQKYKDILLGGRKTKSEEQEKNTQQKAIEGGLKGSGMVASGIAMAKFVEGIWRNSNLTRNLMDTYMKVFGHFADLITLSLLPLLIPFLRFLITTVRPIVKQISDWLSGDEDDNWFERIIKQVAQFSAGFLILNMILGGLPLKLLYGVARIFLGPAFGLILKTATVQSILGAGGKLMAIGLGAVGKLITGAVSFIGPMVKGIFMGAILPSAIALLGAYFTPKLIKITADLVSGIEEALTRDARETHHANLYSTIQEAGFDTNVEKVLTYQLQEFVAREKFKAEAAGEDPESGAVYQGLQGDIARLTENWTKFIAEVWDNGFEGLEEKFGPNSLDALRYQRAYTLFMQALDVKDNQVTADPQLLKDILSENFQFSRDYDATVGIAPQEDFIREQTSAEAFDAELRRAQEYLSAGLYDSDQAQDVENRLNKERIALETQAEKDRLALQKSFQNPQVLAGGFGFGQDFAKNIAEAVVGEISNSEDEKFINSFLSAGREAVTGNGQPQTGQDLVNSIKSKYGVRDIHDLKITVINVGSDPGGGPDISASDFLDKTGFRPLLDTNALIAVRQDI